MQVNGSGRSPKETALQSKRLGFAIAIAVTLLILSIELIASTASRTRLEGGLPKHMQRVIDQRLSMHPLPALPVQHIPSAAVPGGLLVAANTTKIVAPVMVAAPLDTPPAARPQPATSLKTTIAKPKGSESAFGGSVRYGISTDLARPEERRTYKHTIGAGLGYKLKAAGLEIADLGVEVTGQMMTVDNQIDGSRKDIVELADVELSASRGFKLGSAIGGDHSLTTSLGHAMPTSEDSRYEGVKGISTLGVGTASKFFGGKFSVSNTVTSAYIFNTYSHSPVSNRVNPEQSIADALGFSVKLVDWLRFTVGGSISWMRYHDGTLVQSFGNSLGLAGIYKEYSLSLKSSNGAHPDEASQFQMLYYDQYRRMTSLTMSRSF